MDFLVKTLYDSGTAKILEDQLIVQPPFFGVLDGVSGLYNPTIGPELFDGKSGGQKAVEIVNEVFTKANNGDELAVVMKKANVMLRKFFRSHGVGTNRADLLPGMMFVFAKIAEDKVEIIQGGDCYAVWKKTNGEISATPNQNFSDEEEKIKIFDNIVKKHHGNLNEAWAEYILISARLKIERANKNSEKRTVILNGQTGGEGNWFKMIFPRKELMTLLLLTDGMIEFGESRDTEKMSKIIFDAYSDQGLSGMLSRIRGIENRRTGVTYIKHAEATALALEFRRT
jgi:serine/threonine protein phosphatase PrpC